MHHGKFDCSPVLSFKLSPKLSGLEPSVCMPHYAGGRDYCKQRYYAHLKHCRLAFDCVACLCRNQLLCRVRAQQAGAMSLSLFEEVVHRSSRVCIACMQSDLFDCQTAWGWSYMGYLLSLHWLFRLPSHICMVTRNIVCQQKSLLHRASCL